jgi:hypothetical protein
MKKLTYWGVMAVIGLLIGVTLWWATLELTDSRDPLNQSDAYVYSNNGMLYWFELTSRNGKVEGTFHQQKLLEENEKPPSIDETKYHLIGEKTKKGYEFKVDKGREMIAFDAWFSGPHLSVQEHGEKENKLFNPVDLEELEEYEAALLNYHSEEKENNRVRKFFSDLRNVYGYLHTPESGSYQLFIQIDEALLEGELTGSLLMLTNTGNENPPYVETRYDLNGVTDGMKVKFFTSVDGKETKLEGDFHEGATRFDLSFWTTNEKVMFHALTEEEFKQSYEEFIRRQN